MSNNRIIGLFGARQTDICLFLATLFQNLGLKVLVVDNSYEMLMSYCIPGARNTSEYVKHKGISVKIHLEPEKWSECEQEIIIVDMGIWPSDEAMDLCNEIYLVSDLSIAMVEKYKSLISRVEIPVSVVFRNICDEAISPSNLMHMFSNDNPFIYEYHILRPNEDDIINQIIMQYHGFYRFLYISDDMQKLLLDIARSNCIVSEARLQKALKKAQRGGVYENTVSQ